MNVKRKTWLGTGQQILIGLVLATLIVAVIEANSDYDEECGWSLMGTTISHYGSGGKHKIRIGRGRCRLDVELKGDIDFTADNRGIERLRPGAELRIKQRLRRERRRLDVERGAGGKPEYTWYVNSLRRDFDDEARTWLAEVLPKIYRTTGLEADDRVEQLWSAGGFDAVLAEMAEIPNNHVRGTYLRELLARCETEDEFVRALELGRREISSDHELGTSLEVLEPRDLASGPVLEAWTAALRTIDSDWQLVKTLTALLEKDGLTSDIVDAALEAALTVSSDHSQAELLVTVAKAYPETEDLPPGLVRALESIGSDHEQKRALKAFLLWPAFSADEVDELLATTRGISDDYALAELLTELADDYPPERQLPPSFFRALETIDADQALGQVLSAAVKRPGLDREAFVGLLEAGRSVSADWALSAFLVDFVKAYPSAGELPPEFARLLDKVDAEWEREKVDEALAERDAMAARPSPTPAEDPSPDGEGESAGESTPTQPDENRPPPAPEEIPPDPPFSKGGD